MDASVVFPTFHVFIHAFTTRSPTSLISEINWKTREKAEEEEKNLSHALQSRLVEAKSIDRRKKAPYPASF